MGYSGILRFEHSATLLWNGTVLVVGSAYASDADSQIFDPKNTEQWVSTGMPMDRYLHTGTVLSDGRVLVAGWVIPDQTNVRLMERAAIRPEDGLRGPAIVRARLCGLGRGAEARRGRRVAERPVTQPLVDGVRLRIARERPGIHLRLETLPYLL